MYFAFLSIMNTSDAPGFNIFLQCIFYINFRFTTTAPTHLERARLEDARVDLHRRVQPVDVLHERILRGVAGTGEGRGGHVHVALVTERLRE